MTYDEFVVMTGLTQEQLDKSVNIDNVISPTILNDFELRDSDIQGTGFFTTRSYQSGEFVGVALVKEFRTELGRYVNHSATPNVSFQLVDDGITVVALRDISREEEIVCDYSENYECQRAVVEYNGMDKMEVYLRSLSKAKDGVDYPVETKVFDNSGIAVRYIQIPAGEVVLGKVHKEWNVNILTQGSLWVTSDPTKDFVRIEAPYTFETGPGAQKFVMCETDCVFMNVIRALPNETEDEVVNRMAEETKITKEITCQ